MTAEEYEGIFGVMEVLLILILEVVSGLKKTSTLKKVDFVCKLYLDKKIIATIILNF